MRRFIAFLDRTMTPVLILVYIALCILLLAVAQPGTGGGLMIGMLWGAGMMAALRWGVYGILKLAHRNGKESRTALTALVRTAEILLLLLACFGIGISVLFREFPAVWLLIPVFLFGLRGALRFDAEYL